MQNNEIKPVPKELTKAVLKKMFWYLAPDTVPVEINAIAQKMRSGSATGFKRRFKTVHYEEFLALTYIIEWPRGYIKPEDYDKQITDLKTKLTARGIKLM